MINFLKKYGVRCYFAVLAVIVLITPRYDQELQAKYSFLITWIPAAKRYLELSHFPTKTLVFQISSIALSPLVLISFIGGYNKKRIDAIDGRNITRMLFGTGFLLGIIVLLACQDTFTGQGLAGGMTAGVSISVVFLAVAGPLMAYFPLLIAYGFLVSLYIATSRSMDINSKH